MGGGASQAHDVQDVAVARGAVVGAHDEWPGLRPRLLVGRYVIHEAHRHGAIAPLLDDRTLDNAFRPARPRRAADQAPTLRQAVGGVDADLGHKAATGAV